jgi:hypothetical protein
MTAIHTEPQNGTPDTRRAWWSLLGFVPSFVLAFLIGEGLISVLGYDLAGGDQPPVWAILTAVLPALAVFVLPAVLAVHFGRRAMGLGDERGRIPVIVALVLAAGFVLSNAVSGIAILLSRGG